MTSRRLFRRVLATSAMRPCSAGRLPASLYRGTTIDRPASARPRDLPGAPPDTFTALGAILTAFRASRPRKRSIAHAACPVARRPCALLPSGCLLVVYLRRESLTPLIYFSADRW